mmetsp:Transcript_10116/g.29904  ORF Transcript_10116/g.29904 Transcript_10116/m.29904 type:complete len:83 (+) Transcript_10116:195-443(+)
MSREKKYTEFLDCSLEEDYNGSYDDLDDFLVGAGGKGGGGKSKGWKKGLGGAKGDRDRRLVYSSRHVRSRVARGRAKNSNGS